MARKIDKSYLGVNFFGPVNQNSGYGNAVRNFSKAFSISGINTSYSFYKDSLQKRKMFKKELKNYNGKCNVDFYLHCPGYVKYLNSNYKIGYFYWETDSFPPSWNRSIRMLDEIWAPCELVKNSCIKAGFSGPIEIVPTPIQSWSCNKQIAIPSANTNTHVISNKVFKFYSIFQWHYRKGFDVLLKSYLNSFSSKDNVILILKCNPLGVGDSDINEIRRDIIKIKSSIDRDDLPLIYLITNYVDQEDIFALHNYANCFVLPHRGEGWGIPIHDALYAGNNVITTKYGGITEQLSKSNAHIISHKKTPVKNMEWCSFYNQRQNWAEPSVSHLSELMVDMYRNYNKYSKQRKRATQLASTMDIESVSKIIHNIFVSRGFKIEK